MRFDAHTLPISRRRFVEGIFASGSGLAVTRPGTPEASPVTSTDRKLFVSHPSRLTASVPTAWHPGFSSIDNMQGPDGFLFTVSLSGTSVDDAFANAFAEMRITNRPQPSPLEWRSHPALAFDTVLNGQPTSTILIPHGHPFEARGRRVDYIAISADPAHIDGIMDSLDFNPGQITPEIFLDSIIDRMEYTSIYANKIDWVATRNAANDLLTDSTSWVTTYPGILYAIDQLRAAGDHHSFFSRPQTGFATGTFQTSGLGIDISLDHVITVYPGGPADLAGVQFGDRIVAINDVPFVPSRSTNRLDASAKATLTLKRQDTLVKIEVTPGEYSIRPLPTGRMIESSLGGGKTARIAYLRIPTSIELDAVQDYLRVGHDLVKHLDGQSPRGWMVDFRTNGGGSYPPMLGTLAPLLPDGPVFGFQDVNGTQTMVSLEGQRMIQGDGQSYELVPNPYTLSIQSPPIAVLIDSSTASAAEVTALAFKGLPNARFFGWNSAGATTGNIAFSLFDGSLLALATAVEIDRTRKVYREGVGIPVDDYVSLTPETYLLDEDPVIQAALSWLGEQ